MDSHELTFPFVGTCEFLDLEGEDRLKISPEDFRKNYLRNLEDFKTRTRRICEKFKAHYLLVDTGKSVAETLAGYLAFRKSISRKHA